VKNIASKRETCCSMSSPRDALVLTAGLGTRLRPLTLVRAKPAIPVGGVPLIRRILTWLSTSGIERAVLNLHHLPHTITRIVGDGSDLGLCVRYSWEQPAVLGSAGGPRLALPLIDADPFLVVNGDTLTDVDLEALTAAHRESGALVTLALTPNREPLRYGGLRLDPFGWVTGVSPKGPGAAGSYHFVGVQMVQAAAFRSIEPGTFANSIGDLYSRLLTEWPTAIAGFVSQPDFFDVGTIEDYLATARHFGAGDAGRTDAHPGTIDPTATVTGSILWDGVVVGPRAVVEDCVVTDGVHIPPGTVYRRVILISEGSKIGSYPLAGPKDPPYI
jgi:NDP-sugar pyrophosphorylase family protein